MCCSRPTILSTLARAGYSQKRAWLDLFTNSFRSHDGLCDPASIHILEAETLRGHDDNMSQRIRSSNIKKRRGFTYLWIFGLAVSVFLLIYFEQTSLLYILATLGVTILLVIVATADLGQSERSSEAAAQMSESVISIVRGEGPKVKRSSRQSETRRLPL